MEFNIYNYLANIAYINKDFNSIWEEIINFIPKLSTKWNPGEANESDPLVVLLKELGIVEDKLNYNIDKNTLEQFPDLLTQVRTAYSVFKSMGYNPAWYRSATTKINIIYNGGIGATNSSSVSSADRGCKLTIPRFTQVSNEDFTQIYTLLENVEFKVGSQESKDALAIEGTCNDFEIGGNTLITAANLDSRNRLYFVQPNIAQNGIFISSNSNFDDVIIESIDNSEISGKTNDINDNVKNSSVNERIQKWTRVNNIYQYLPDNKVFRFGIDPSNGSNYIQFPDDVGELIGSGIYIKYILSSGSQGNIASKEISTLVNDPGSLGIEGKTFNKSNFTINNGAATQNGKDPETIEEMQKNYERVVGTFDTLVTLRDYENYIYNAEDTIGQHVVSNVRVGDINNDLYNTQKVVTQATDGTISRMSVSNGKIDSFGLVLYPLKPQDNINNYSDFKRTFTAAGDGEDLNTPWIANIIDSTKDVKAINHQWMLRKDPIFVDYDLGGQIYLQKSVSATEALEIQSNIYTAVYRAVNSRELTWGEGINYQKLVDVIKNADSRIQYAAIDAINYNEVESNSELDATKSAILAGVTPWTDFSEFKFFYYPNDSADAVVTTYPDTEGKTITKIIPMPKWKYTVENDSTKVTVQENETLSILMPGYRTEATYSNYFYAVYGEESSGKLAGITGDDSSSFKTIPLNTPYTLPENEYICIYDTRDSAEGKKPGNATYKIGEGETVTISGSGTDVKDGFPSGTVVNMGSKISISTIVKDINGLYNTDNPNDPDAQIKILTNSKGLIDAFTKEKGPYSYTLDIGEYLLFANYNADSNVVLEVGIIGEGNTIITKNRVVQEDAESAGLIKVSLGETSNAEQMNSMGGIIFKNNELSYRPNTIYSFGKDYIIDFHKDVSSQTSPGVHPLTGVTTIDYGKENEDTQPLPSLAKGDTYLYSYQLALVLTPGNYQTLKENQTVTLEYKDGGESTIPDPKSTNSGDTIIQSNMSLIYSGGPGLSISEEEGKNLKIITTSGIATKDSPNESSTYFTPLNGKTYKVPTAEGLIAGFIVPCVVDGEGVKYWLASTGSAILTSLGSKEVSSIGPLYAIKIGARIYKMENKGWEDLETKSSKWLDANLNLYLLGDSEFCPVYQPKDSELIANPKLPSSYFNPYHPFNRYVLPKLTPENTTGNPMSKLLVSNLSIRG